MRPSLPVCRCLTLHLLSSWGSGFVHLCVETVQLLQGSLRLVGPCCRASGWGCADDECLRRGWLAEVVDAGVIGIAIVVFKVGEGGGVRGEVAGADLCVPRIIAVRQRKRGQAHREKPLISCQPGCFSDNFFLSLFASVFFFCCMEKHQKSYFYRSHTCRWCWESCPAPLHSEPPICFLQLCSCPLFSFQTWIK